MGKVHSRQAPSASSLVLSALASPNGVVQGKPFSFAEKRTRMPHWRQKEVCSMHTQIESLWRELLWLRVDNAQLRCVIKHVSTLREAAWEILLTQCPNSMDFIYVIVEVPCLRDRAWVKLVEFCPDRAELVYVMQHIPSLRAAAWEEFLNRFPDEKDLRQIATMIPALEREALAQIQVIVRRGIILNELARMSK